MTSYVGEEHRRGLPACGVNGHSGGPVGGALAQRRYGGPGRRLGSAAEWRRGGATARRRRGAPRKHLAGSVPRLWRVFKQSAERLRPTFTPHHVPSWEVDVIPRSPPPYLHSSLHTTMPTHKCTYCPRAFPSAATRQRHMMTLHSDDNPLVAPVQSLDSSSSSGAVAEMPESAAAASGADQRSVGGEFSTDEDGVAPEAPVAAGQALRTAASAGTGLAVTAAANAFVNETPVQFLTRQRNDGVARGTIAGPRPLAGAVRHVFAASVAARIQAYYEAMPEASKCRPAVSPLFSQASSRFRGMIMRSVLKFALGAGGCGLSRKDQSELGSLLLKVEAGVHGDDGGVFSDTFETGSSFVQGLRTEQNRVVSDLKWMQAPIELGGNTYMFYYRDLLDAGVMAVRSAHVLDLEGGPLPPAADGSPRRSSTLNADMFVQEVRAVKTLHGQRARPLFASLHADAAVVSWSGAAYVYPIRAQFPSVRDEGCRWMTVGYVPHIGKAVIHTDNAKMAVSDWRNDLLQRCLALVLRRFARASETGYPVDIPDIGTVLLVARIGGIVVDFIEERSIYALKGTGSNMICTLCRVNLGVCCSPDAPDADPRNVIETLEAQMNAAERRLVDPRASLRAPLAKAHSALPFVPVLGSVHGLSTGNMNYFRVLSFDLLHVWKLGVLRTLAQRLPGFLRAVCTTQAGAVLGPVQKTLDVLNLRGFELGRRCRVKHVAPGCFVPPQEKQATMTGRSWRHLSVFWPHVVAGLIGPADPERLAAGLPSETPADPSGPAMPAVDSGSDEDDDEEAHQPIPAGIKIGAGTAYHGLFGTMAVQDAVQEMFCQAAELGGMLFGDNVTDTVHTTGTEVTAMERAARQLGRCAQVLLGPVHTSKLHRLMRHLRAELEVRGNLWEGDTSSNESLHKVCKKMYLRSNKRGPTLAMQMMRGEQAQTEILRGLADGDSDEEDISDDEERAEELNAVRMARVDDVSAVPDIVLHMSTRGVRISVAELSAFPGFSNLPELLEMDVAASVSAAKTVKFYAKFEWGAPTRIQYLRATPAFNGKPWFDHVRYMGDNAEVRWGEARMVLRRVGPTRRPCVILRRMRVAAPVPGCVLTAHGCQRLAWHFQSPEAMWPTVEVVEVGQLLRLENIVPDWRDLASRRGIDAMPSQEPTTMDEYRQQRFFVNAFYPWTSRPAIGDH